MEFIETITLNTILLIFPITIYAFYTINNKNYGKKYENSLFDFTLITSLYLLIKFGLESYYSNPIILINVVLLIAYYKNKNLSILFLSTYLIIYYNQYYQFFYILLIFEYLLYFILHKIKNIKFITFSILFLILKMGFVIMGFYLLNENKNIDVLYFFILSIMAFITLYIIVYFFIKTETIISYHQALKDLENEKKIRTSLFKITHEIKNPIAVCKGYLDMFDVNDIDKSSKYINVMKEEINRILFMLEDFLSTKEIELNNEILDFNYLVESVLEKYTFILKEEKIVLEKNLIDDELYINGDYNRLIQVIINLFKNAIESLDESKVKKIVIKQTIENNYIVLSIKDSGCGMSDDVLKNFKNPFYTTKKRGNGLGVSLSIEIIQKHNGKVEYITKEKKGTEVILKVPLYIIK
ncbi:MAG: HAMP domain-containing sensor histidine kinase [Mycoplasmatota bacterium]